MDEKPTQGRRKLSKEVFKPNLANQVKLVWRLLRHPDVPFSLKLLPIGAFIYLVWPFDFMVGPVDDAAAIWLATVLFVDSCPPHAVAECKRDIANPAQRIKPTPVYEPINEEDIVEGEFRDADEASSKSGPETPPKKSAGGKRSRRTPPKDPNAL